ncbi:MAG: DNA-directed RNA polymerase subunit alpha [Dehalococcoidia bacterium]|nr:DNA-directed RNA polymerase subunit alpha [Dehalococcoidia bacterium]|tara:strand:- start:1719 stop:2717 length:999 start_codon:yes stop_codon:yes gene_type:complete
MLERMYGITPQDELPPSELEVPGLSIVDEENGESYGRFIVQPLEKGWGVTLGNPIRRILLNSLSGTAITWIKIDGIQHEYSTLENMREGIVEFILNVKGVRIKSLTDRPGRLRLDVSGEGEIKAGDIMATSDFEIVNPDHHLATLDNEKARLSVEFNVDQGTGYLVGSNDEGLPIGVLPVDAIFSPVRKVNFEVEPTRVGQNSDLEKLVIEVWTDKTISPLDALQSASNQLMDKFYLFTQFDKKLEESDAPTLPGVSPEIFNTLVETLDLSARTLNCLKRANINRVGEVLMMPKGDVLKIRNFGQKSLDELYDKLAEYNYLPNENGENSVEA